MSARVCARGLCTALGVYACNYWVILLESRQAAKVCLQQLCRLRDEHLPSTPLFRSFRRRILLRHRPLSMYSVRIYINCLSLSRARARSLSLSLSLSIYLSALESTCTHSCVNEINACAHAQTDRLSRAILSLRAFSCAFILS
jgi:hypothetical protein